MIFSILSSPSCKAKTKNTVNRIWTVLLRAPFDVFNIRSSVQFYLSFLFCGNSGYFDICRRHAEFDCRLSSIIYFIIVVRKNSMCVHYCWFMPARRTTTKKIHSMYFHSFHFKHMHIPYAYGKGMRILEFYVFTWFFLQILLGNLFTEHLLSLLKIWVNSSCTHHSLLERNDQRVNRIRTEQIVAGIN